MKNIDSKTVYLQGGLGNQLFQYAFFEYLNGKYSEHDTYLEFGRLYYDKQHGGVSILSLVNVENDVIKENSVSDLPNVINDKLISKLIRQALRFINYRDFGRCYYDFDATSTLSYVNLSKNHFVGYFQFVDAAIFSKEFIEKRIYEKNKEKIDSFKLKFHNHIALHIRRGDFITSKDSKHPETSEAIINECLMSFSDRDVLICSDDINWCKSRFSNLENITFFCGGAAIDDFLALSQCRDSITLGSTFSWWASFLFSDDSSCIYAKKSNNIQYLTEESLRKLNWLFI